MNGSRYPRIFERLYGRPLLLLPDRAFGIARVFEANLVMSSEEVRAKAFSDGMTASADGGDGYTVTAGGVALLEVMGTMVQRSSFMDTLSGMTSYAQVGFSFAQAEADPNVRGILLEIDSGGGEVNGCFDLVDQIAASTKPVWAVANEAAYSAAYAIASAADKLIMPRTAGVGSIGVIALHVDQSVRDQKAGYTYTPIYAGSHKNDFSSHAPLPDDQRAAVQADIDRLYQLFVSTVASNRSMTAEAVIATQADVFHTAAAIDLGLADDTGTLDDAINQFEDFLASPAIEQSRLSGSASPRFSNAAAAAPSIGVHMDPKDTAAQPASITPEALATARAEAAQSGRTEGLSAGAEAERARVSAILGSEEAKDRTELATHLALETGMAADDAKKLLAKSPKVASVPVAAVTNAFAAAMDAAGNPKVHADGGDDAALDANAEIDEATKTALRIASAGGRKVDA